MQAGQDESEHEDAGVSEDEVAGGVDAYAGADAGADAGAGEGEGEHEDESEVVLEMAA